MFQIISIWKNSPCDLGRRILAWRITLASVVSLEDASPATARAAPAWCTMRPACVYAKVNTPRSSPLDPVPTVVLDAPSLVSCPIVATIACSRVTAIAVVATAMRVRSDERASSGVTDPPLTAATRASSESVSMSTCAPPPVGRRATVLKKSRTPRERKRVIVRGKTADATSRVWTTSMASPASSVVFCVCAPVPELRIPALINGSAKYGHASPPVQSGIAP